MFCVCMFNASPTAEIYTLSLHDALPICPENKQVQVVISDGLSAEAVHHNMQHLLPILLEGFVGRGINVGVPLLVRYGRVKLAEPIAEKLETDLVVHLIGERPGGDALASR